MAQISPPQSLKYESITKQTLFQISFQRPKLADNHKDQLSLLRLSLLRLSLLRLFDKTIISLSKGGSGLKPTAFLLEIYWNLGSGFNLS